MYASKSRKDLTFGEDLVKIQKLSGTQIDKAHEVKSRANVADLRAMGGELLVALRSAPDEVEKARANVAARKADVRQTRLDALDRATALGFGIVEINGAVPSPAEVQDIEEEIAKGIYEGIVDFTYGSEAEAAKS